MVVCKHTLWYLRMYLKDTLMVVCKHTLWLGNIRKFIILIYNKHFNRN